MREPQVLTVTQVNRRVRRLLEESFGEVWVEGEISNLRKQASGHQYFSLKDDGGQLSCVWFRGASRSAGSPKLVDGQQVQAFGELSVYEARGQYQLVVKLVQPKGLGALQARFEALKRKLHDEGLFDPARKRVLPKFPGRIGVVTSPTGAALRDMLNVLGRRAPWIGVVVHPVRVQGDGAAAEIAAAIADFNRADFPAPVDLIVVARGGGSIEDLWQFNEEIVARAIVACGVPVVSAVGHEIDFTIADFAADLRAPTPSAAAELIAPDSQELAVRFTAFGTLMNRRLREVVAGARGRLRVCSSGVLLREPPRRLRDSRLRVDDVSERLARSARDRIGEMRRRMEGRVVLLREHRPDAALARVRERLGWNAKALAERLPHQMETRRRRLQAVAGKLAVLGPDATLRRGFTITLDAEGVLLREAKGVAPGAVLRTRFADGEVRSVAGEKSL